MRCVLAWSMLLWSPVAALLHQASLAGGWDQRSGARLGFVNRVFRLARSQDHAESLGREMRAGGSSWDDERFLEPAKAPPVLVTHLLKAGGSMVGSLLRQFLFFESNYYNQNEVGGIDASLREKKLNQSNLNASNDLTKLYPGYFRIGFARNPCDYLLSMWAFQSMPYGRKENGEKDTGHSEQPRQCLSRTLGFDSIENVTEYYADGGKYIGGPFNIARFNRWVRATAGQTMHYLSYRSYLALHLNLAPRDLTGERPEWDDGQFFACLGSESNSNQEEMAKRLAAADLSDRYDCLIHTETLPADTRACLLKYADRLGDAHAAQGLRDRIRQYRWEGVDHGNPSKHAECRAYFDQDLKDFVWQREGRFAAKLGYTACCA